MYHERYLQLKAMQDSGEITQLRRNVQLLRITNNDIKTAEPYTAEFSYIDKDGCTVIEKL